MLSIKLAFVLIWCDFCLCIKNVVDCSDGVEAFVKKYGTSLV